MTTWRNTCRRFLDETEEQLDDLVETMLSLENASTNAEDLNEAFRLIHSIKGSAGMMGLDHITVLTHHLENRFERFRSGTEQLDEPTMNLVLRCIDFLRQCNDRLREGQKLGQPYRVARRIEAIGRAGATFEAKPDDAPVSPAADGASAEQSSNRRSMRQHHPTIQLLTCSRLKRPSQRMMRSFAWSFDFGPACNWRT